MIQPSSSVWVFFDVFLLGSFYRAGGDYRLGRTLLCCCIYVMYSGCPCVYVRYVQKSMNLGRVFSVTVHRCLMSFQYRRRSLGYPVVA